MCSGTIDSTRHSVGELTPLRSFDGGPDVELLVGWIDAEELSLRVANFVADPQYIQQAFATSEPFFARKAGIEIRVLLTSDAGYNPYRVMSAPRMTASVKVCGCRPHEGGATHTGAGVRKPPKEETAGGRERWSVRSYGNLVAGALLPKCIERVFGKRSRGQRTRSTDRDMQNRRCASEIEREDGCP